MRDLAFHSFFERHHAELSRLAYLLSGDASAADDLAADALTEVWRHWERVAAAGDPAAYARGIVANLTRGWIRRQGRARRGLHLLSLGGGDRRAGDPDVPAVLDVRAALRRLPYRRRACVVLAVAAVLGLGGVARWALADDDGPDVPAAPPVVTVPPIASPSPSPPTGVTPSRTTASSAPASVVRGHPGDTQVTKGSLSSDGSVRAGGVSEVTLKPKAALTELNLTVRLATTPGLSPAGGSADDDRVETSVERRDGAILYHFTLARGAELPPGTYVFTARYQHAGTRRDAGDDTYEAFARSVERKEIHVYGNFFPAE